MTSSVRRVKGVQKKLGTFAAKSFFFHRRTPLIMAKSGTLELPPCQTARACVGGDVYIIRFAFASVFFAHPFSIHCISS